MSNGVVRAIWPLLLLTLLLTIYLPHAGHGFVKDDYRWIATSRISSPGDFPRLFTTNVGFYRPLISATFALDHELWKLDPFGYGVTNIILLLADAVLLYALGRRLSLRPGPALLGASVWAFNLTGVNMALLWISGRTALVLVLFSLFAAHAHLAGRHLLAGVFALLALLSKEEAVLLPLFLTVLAAITLPNRSVRELARRTWPAWLGLAVYAGLRGASGAFGPGDAPEHYRFTFTIPLLARNVVEYLNRAATLHVAVLLVTWATAKGLALLPAEKHAVRFGALWFIAFYGLTLWLPVRSDLYALAPSIGSALMVGAVTNAASRVNSARVARLSIALLVLTCLAVPIYRMRNMRWVTSADVAASAIRTMKLRTAALGGSGIILLVDDPAQRFNLDAAFGSGLPDAIRLFVGDRWSGRLVAPSAPLPKQDESAPPAIVLRLSAGHLVSVTPPMAAADDASPTTTSRRSP